MRDIAAHRAFIAAAADFLEQRLHGPIPQKCKPDTKAIAKASNSSRAIRRFSDKPITELTRRRGQLPSLTHDKQAGEHSGGNHA